MSAIYQRARPATFTQVVGQDHVKDVLLAALAKGRASHAYLFSGPRGVGKTTTARLLAMALNCEAEEAQRRPCGECESCTLVRQGSHPDVIELDAASNNSVDDVRELREKTSLASMRGGKRVWILDEAHMLSKAAANALLKTLEEPPQGLVFVLATTEPEKLPPTVLSRCQHFRFRRLSEAEISGKLTRLCQEADVEAEPEALALVARSADGAMRDAESLLERLLTPGAKITLAQAEDALGLPPVHRLQRLATALARADLRALFEEADRLYRDGFAPRSLSENLGRVLRDALRNRLLSGEQGDGAKSSFSLPLEQPVLLRLIHALDDEQERFVRRDDLYSLEVALIKALNAAFGNVTATFSSEEPATVAAAAEAGRQDTPERPAGQGESVGTEPGGELPSFDPTGRGAVARAKSTSTSGGGSRRASGASRQNTQEYDAPEHAKSSEPGGGDSGDANVAADSGDGAVRNGKRLDWHAVRSAAGPQLKAFLMPARESVDGQEVVIRYAETHRFHYSELKKREGELARLIEELAGPGYRLRIEGPGDSPTKKS